MKSCWTYISITGLLIASASLPAYGSGPEACSRQTPKNTKAQYNSNGKLVKIVDYEQRAVLRIYYSTEKYPTALISVSETEFKKVLKKPDKFGRTQAWGPARNSFYDSTTGKLVGIRTYEKVRIDDNGRIRGVQTNFDLPKDIDFESLRGKDGVLRYTGKTSYESASAVRPAGVKAVTITEPTNILDAKCINFRGHAYLLRKDANQLGSKNGAIRISEEKIETAPTIKRKRYEIEGGWIEVVEEENEDSARSVR